MYVSYTVQRCFYYFINLVVAYFFIALVIVPKAYSAGIMLAISGVLLFIYYMIKNRTKINVNRDYIAFIVSFGLYFLVYLLDFWIHEDSVNILDAPSRSVLFLFVFFLLRYFSISFNVLLFAIPTGGILTGVYAFYQKFFLDYARALSNTTYVIQSGDMAMSIGMFSLAIMLYYWSKKNTYLSIFCALGVLGGMLGSFLSGARGGWLLMPIIIVVLFFLNRKLLPKKIVITFFMILLSVFTILVVTPSSRVLQQVEKAYTEVSNFGKEGNSNTSVGARLELWKASLYSIAEKPVFGWGKKGIQQERKSQSDVGILDEFPASLGHAHNQYLNDMLERGIIGLCSLFLIFSIPLWKFIKVYKENRKNPSINLLSTLGIIHVASVMSYGLTQGFLSHNSGNMFYFFVTVLFYAIILNIKQPHHIQLRK